MDKSKAAETIALNMRKALKAKADKEEQPRCRCPTCGQVLPKQLTHAWVAQQCGMSKPTIEHYFQGVRLPSIERLIKIATALDTTVQALLEGVES